MAAFTLLGMTGFLVTPRMVRIPAPGGSVQFPNPLGAAFLGPVWSDLLVGTLTALTVASLPLLAEQGLPAALRAQAARSPLPVRVETDGDTRYQRDVEATVYFCVLEALQNAAKYARAAQATVALACLAVAGGTLGVRSAPGAGTVIAGRIPVQRDAPSGDGSSSGDGFPAPVAGRAEPRVRSGM